MKKYLFKVTAYAFALYAILLFAAGCNYDKQQGNVKSVIKIKRIEFINEVL